MSKLNASREIPFDFQVFEWEGIAWLVDYSTRTYICSATPSAWIEPLYWVDRSYEELPGPTYVNYTLVEECERLPVPGDWDDQELWTDDEREAWDGAREEAHGNHLI